jgi:hypothetical protein
MPNTVRLHRVLATKPDKFLSRLHRGRRSADNIWSSCPASACATRTNLICWIHRTAICIPSKPITAPLPLVFDKGSRCFYDLKFERSRQGSTSNPTHLICQEREGVAAPRGGLCS